MKISFANKVILAMRGKLFQSTLYYTSVVLERRQQNVGIAWTTKYVKEVNYMLFSSNMLLVVSSTVPNNSFRASVSWSVNVYPVITNFSLSCWMLLIKQSVVKIWRVHIRCALPAIKWFRTSWDYETHKQGNMLESNYTQKQLVIWGW